MTAVRIHRLIESETLHLPELKAFLGQEVDIVVTSASPKPRATEKDWEEALQALRELDGYDFDAWKSQREYDLQHAKDHLP